MMLMMSTSNFHPLNLQANLPIFHSQNSTITSTNPSTEFEYGGAGGGPASTRRRWALKNYPYRVRVSSSNDNQTIVVTAPAQKAAEDDEESPSVSSSSSSSFDSASDVVRKFYRGINRHDLASVEDLIAENCVYEDLIFPRPFEGRKAILEFFQKFINSISTDLLFAIDDISDEDSSAVGVMWHLEWKGKPFPFSKGCSFYLLEVVNGRRQIIYGRDSVEPAIKPGEAALVAIRGVAWLLQQFPQLADRL